MSEPAEPVEGKKDGRAIQETHDQRLTVNGGHRRDADVHAPAARRHADAPVLGQPALGDVHLRHELDARGEGGLELARRRLPVVEDAVHAIAHAETVLEGLDVDVRGLRRDGLVDEEVDEPDHGRLERHVAKLVDVLLGLALSRPAGAHAFHDLLQRCRSAIGALDRVENGGRGSDAQGDAPAEHMPEVVEQQGIGRVGGRHRDRRAIDGDGAGHVLAQILRGEVLDDRRCARQLFGRHEGQSVLLGQRPQHLFRGGRAHRHQRLAKLFASFLGPEQRVPEHILREDAGLEQDLPQPLDHAWCAGRCNHDGVIMSRSPRLRQID